MWRRKLFVLCLVAVLFVVLAAAILAAAGYEGMVAA